MIRDLIRKNRSYRRFHQDFIIDSKTLLDLIDLARLTASGANKQPLRYKIVNQPNENAKVFSCLSWAGYLTDWPGPSEGEKPSAYIIILSDNRISQNPQFDVGLACQSVLMGAVEENLGGCLFGSIKKEKLRDLFKIPQEYDIMLVMALGKPKEKVVIVETDDDIKYWRDETGLHYVPKRKLEDLII